MERPYYDNVKNLDAMGITHTGAEGWTSSLALFSIAEDSYLVEMPFSVAFGSSGSVDTFAAPCGFMSP